MAYQVVDHHLSDAEFAQLRYQAQILDHTVSQSICAQSVLDAFTEVRADSGTSSKVQAAADHVAATSARLTAHVRRDARDDANGQGDVYVGIQSVTLSTLLWCIRDRLPRLPNLTWTVVTILTTSAVGYTITDNAGYKR